MVFGKKVWMSSAGTPPSELWATGGSTALEFVNVSGSSPFNAAKFSSTKSW